MVHRGKLLHRSVGISYQTLALARYFAISHAWITRLVEYRTIQISNIAARQPR